MLPRTKYNPIFRMLAVVIPVLIVAAVITGYFTGFTPQRKEGVSAAPLSSSSKTAPINGPVQSSSGGAVTVDVKWLSAEKEILVFAVSLNTHSVNLDQYDLGKLAVLRDDGGNEYNPTSWKSAPGGHHRKGTLTFAVPDSLSQKKAKYLELILRDVAGVAERAIKWELS